MIKELKILMISIQLFLIIIGVSDVYENKIELGIFLIIVNTFGLTTNILNFNK